MRAAVLRRALPQQKVVEGGNLQQPIGLYGESTSTSCRLNSTPKRMLCRPLVNATVSCQMKVFVTCHCEGVPASPIVKPADHHCRGIRRRSRRARRRALPDRLRGDRILHRRRAVKPHVAEPRDVHQVRVEDVRVRQHKHRVAVSAHWCPSRERSPQFGENGSVVARANRRTVPTACSSCSTFGRCRP